MEKKGADMNLPREYKIQGHRQLKVLKANALIQNSRYQLSTQEQKLVLFMLANIRADDEALREVHFSIHDFCAVCGIRTHSGGNLEYIKQTIKKLADRSVWIKNDKGEETLIRWIEKPRIYKGKVRIKLDQDLAPYLLQLRKNFTQISLLYILAMSCQYSIRMYEFFKSVQYQGNSHHYLLSDFKHMLDISNYERFADFRRYVFDPAIREINDLTDITVDFVFKKEGRKFTSVLLDIRDKEILPKLMATWQSIEERLDKLSFEDVKRETVQL
jgi:plasmid replication initiation protein